MRFFLLVVLVLGMLTSAVQATCNASRLSYDLCNSDTLCRDSFYINENGEDVEVFTFLYYRFATHPALESLLCSHDNSTLVYNSSGHVDPTGLDDFYVLWIATMSSYHFCPENEYFDAVLQVCTCKQDKTCEFISPRDMEFHTSNYVLIFFIIPIIFFAVLFTVMRELKAVYAMLNSVRVEGFNP